jgi:hypothetical protein
MTRKANKKTDCNLNLFHIRSLCVREGRGVYGVRERWGHGDMGRWGDEEDGEENQVTEEMIKKKIE